MNLSANTKQQHPLPAAGNFWLKAILLNALAFFAFSVYVRAQEPTTLFDHITVENGLSHGTVFSIVQDETGFMWFGTPSGLNKYDGYNFRIFRHNPEDPNSVSNDNAGNLYLDSSGNIWIGTWGGGLNKLDPLNEQFTRYTHNPNDPHSLSSDRVQTVFEDSAGTLWVGTAGGGLNKLVAETFIRYQHDPENSNSLSNDRIWKIVEDDSGILWLATSDGLNRFDSRTESFTHYRHNPEDFNTLSDSLIRTLFVDSAGTLWVGTENGLNKYNPQKDNFTRYQHNPEKPHSLSDNIINAILEDSAGNFWVGTSRGGLNKFDRQSEKFIRYVNDPRNAGSISYNDVRSILEDRSGVLWIATRGGGVNKITPISGKFTYMAFDPNNPNSLNNNDVRAIYIDRANNLWVGTKGGGLNKYNQYTQTFTYYLHDPDNPNSLGSNDVYAIYEDQGGVFWLGLSGGGLDKFDPQTENFTHYRHNPDDPNSLSSDDINSIYQDQAGQLWIGTKGGGLNQFDPESEKFTPYQHNPEDPSSLGNNDVYSIIEDSSGTLWVSSYGGGLNALHRETGQFTRYQHNPDDPASLNNDDIYTVLEDRSGKLWVGAGNGGLNQFDRDANRFIHFTEEDGLPSNVVYGILESDTPGEGGNLWLSTSKGLSKFNSKTQSFITYDASSGLKNVIYQQGAFYKNRDGEMLFGGINGLIRFYPRAIKDNKHPPRVVLTAFRLLNQEVALNAPPTRMPEFILSHNDDFFSFEFTALDYTNQSKNQFAYKLEGFNEDWIHTGNRPFATFTNLDPGDYTFKVKGANNAGVWSEAEALIKVTVTPPFWEAWWFRMVVVISVLSVIVGGYTLRIKTIQAQRERLQILVNERTVELSEANTHLKSVTRRIQEELALARKIQHNLLPSPDPNWPQLDVLCYSASANEVGGDFYLYHSFDNAPAEDADETGASAGRFAIAVGDASGKGMPAALLMAVSIASFQSFIEQDPKPADLLTLLDESLVPYSHSRYQNCALSYAEITLPTTDRPGRLQAVNAGCIPPIIRRGDGSVERMDVNGLPLGFGLSNIFSYTETNVALNPGDLVILTSDGVVEAMTAGREIFGFEYLEQAIADGSNASTQAMLKHLKNKIAAFVGDTEAHDDLTIVVVKM